MVTVFLTGTETPAKSGRVESGRRGQQKSHTNAHRGQCIKGPVVLKTQDDLTLEKPEAPMGDTDKSTQGPGGYGRGKQLKSGVQVMAAGGVGSL